jgi:sugar O-acyltransferase (sialic acid O-acetyltransferase NeuD family)
MTDASSSNAEQAVVVIGAGGHAAEVCSYIEDLRAAGTPVRLAGCIDDHKPAGRHGLITVLGGLDALAGLIGDGGRPLLAITAVGDNALRMRLVERVEAGAGDRVRWWTLSHPRAVVGSDAVIGPGTCIAPGAVITARVTIGRHGIVNVRASVSHDAVVGDFVNVNPGVVVAGNARLDTGCYIGAGATVIDRIAVGAWTVVGAGAVVVRDLPAHVTAVGVPARVISSRH